MLHDFKYCGYFWRKCLGNMKKRSSWGWTKESKKGFSFAGKYSKRTGEWDRNLWHADRIISEKRSFPKWSICLSSCSIYLDSWSIMSLRRHFDLSSECFVRDQKELVQFLSKLKQNVTNQERWSFSAKGVANALNLYKLV